VTDYRCYRTDASGHFLTVEKFQCINDDEACGRADVIARSQTWNSYELWQGARRLVCRVVDRDHAPKTSAPGPVGPVPDGR
jgi:hypothetical protein